jgi:hypothetical protein
VDGGEGGAGNDRINLRDGGQDAGFDCGDGNDTVLADADDSVDAASCENVQR